MQQSGRYEAQIFNKNNNKNKSGCRSLHESKYKLSVKFQDLRQQKGQMWFCKKVDLNVGWEHSSSVCFFLHAFCFLSAKCPFLCSQGEAQSWWEPVIGAKKGFGRLCSDHRAELRLHLTVLMKLRVPLTSATQLPKITKPVLLD